MEWVETTGKSVEEAKEAALDQLGVDDQDAEFEVLEEPRAGLFGRVRGEARVRARIRPTRPRAKVERRDRRRPRGGEGKGRSRQGERGTVAVAPEPADDQPAEPPASEPSTGAEPEAESTTATGGSRRAATGNGNGGGRRRGRRGRDGEDGTRGRETTDTGASDREGARTMTSELTLEQQGDVVEDFLDGLLDAFDLDGDLRRVEIDDETLEVHIDGDELGLLIGPKGQTLTAIQELARTVVQRRADGPARGRVRLDVAGYREKRREALERFTRQVAEEVRETGVRKALEPMSPPDRKVVHDTVNTIDGVGTISEGEEPRRRVVIVPED